MQKTADKAIRIAHGRSWGGFRAKAQLALLGPDNIRKKFKQGGQPTKGNAVEFGCPEVLTR